MNYFLTNIKHDARVSFRSFPIICDSMDFTFNLIIARRSAPQVPLITACVECHGQLPIFLPYQFIQIYYCLTDM